MNQSSPRSYAASRCAGCHLMWYSPGKTKRSAGLPASRSAVTLSTAARNSSSAASNSNGNRTLCAFLTSDILSQKDGALVVMPGQPIAVSRLVKAGPSQAACSFSQQQPLTIPAANLLLLSEANGTVEDPSLRPVMPTEPGSTMPR